MVNYPDPQLILLAQSGDRDAMDRLISNQLPLLRFVVKLFARRFFSHRLSHDEMMTTAMEAAFLAIPNFKVEGEARSWGQYMKRTVWRAIGREMRKTLRLVNGASYQSANDVWDKRSLTPIEADMRDETIRELREEVEKLDPIQRELVRDRYGINGRPKRTGREIAAETNVTRSEIFLRERKAIETLRSRLARKNSPARLEPCPR